jgi:hypothetical protein
MRTKVPTGTCTDTSIVLYTRVNIYLADECVCIDLFSSQPLLLVYLKLAVPLCSFVYTIPYALFIPSCTRLIFSFNCDIYTVLFQTILNTS